MILLMIITYVIYLVYYSSAVISGTLIGYKFGQIILEQQNKEYIINNLIDY